MVYINYTPLAPITLVFIDFLESLNLRFQEGNGIVLFMRIVTFSNYSIATFLVRLCAIILSFVKGFEIFVVK